MELDKSRWYSDILNVIDSMEGHRFEYFCAKLLELNGYRDVEVTQGSGDFGLDIKARYHNLIYGIQCKRRSKNVGVDGVKDAISGSEYHHCDAAAVITNSYFTKAAVEWADKTGVRLWDRDVLCELIDSCENHDFIKEYVDQSKLYIQNDISKEIIVDTKTADNILKEKPVVKQVSDEKQKNAGNVSYQGNIKPKKTGYCLFFATLPFLAMVCCGILFIFTFIL